MPSRMETMGEKGAAEVRNAGEITGRATPQRSGSAPEVLSILAPSEAKEVPVCWDRALRKPCIVMGSLLPGPVKSFRLVLWPCWNALTRSFFEVRKE